MADTIKVTQGANSGTCNCISGACTIHPKQQVIVTAADPAQSAPSAEPMKKLDIETHSLLELSAFLQKYDCLSMGWTTNIFGIFMGATKVAYEKGKAESETRAETAESALRQIVGNVDLKQLLEWLDFELSGSPGDGMLSDCKEIISRVAAQTPEEK